VSGAPGAAWVPEEAGMPHIWRHGAPPASPSVERLVGKGIGGWRQILCAWRREGGGGSGSSSGPLDERGKLGFDRFLSSTGGITVRREG
jgi:hypothetical protein